MTSSIESLIVLMPTPTHTTEYPKTAAVSFAEASVTTVATDVGSRTTAGGGGIHSPYAKGQVALRTAIAAKGLDRRHWEAPIAPFLQTMTFVTRNNPYCLSRPVQRYIMDPTATTTTERQPEPCPQPTTSEQSVVLHLSPTASVTLGQLSSLGSDVMSVGTMTADSSFCGKHSPSDSAVDITVLSNNGSDVATHMEDVEDTHSHCSSQEMTTTNTTPNGNSFATKEEEWTVRHHDDEETPAQPTNAIIATAPLAAAAALRHPVYHCLWYYRVPTTFPKEVMFGRRCAWALEHCVRRKLGGVCCDAHPLTIANMIYEACDIVPAGVDMFTNFKGRCSVWFRTAEEAQTVEAALHQRVWMAPIEHGYAVWTSPEDAQAMLKLVRSTMTNAAAPRSAATPFGSRGGLNNSVAKHFAFPTHLLTVEEWVTR